MHRQQCKRIDHSQLPIFGICLDQNCNSLRPYCNQCIQQIHIKHVPSLISFEQFQQWMSKRMSSISEIKRFINLSKEIFDILQFLNKISEKEISLENMEKLGINQLNMLAYDLTKIDHLLHFSNWKETNQYLVEIHKYCQTMKKITYIAPIIAQPIIDQPIIAQPIVDQPIIIQPIIDQPQNVMKQNVPQNNILQQDQNQKINDKEPLMNIPKVQMGQQLQGLVEEGFQQQEISKELDIQIWSLTRFIRTKLQINFIKDKEIQYIYEGSIIRSDEIKDTSINTEILNNFEQIQYLQWKGDLGNNNKKVGQWIATWKGQILDGVGGLYNKDGIKNGKWKELIQNYWDQAQVYEEGYYENGYRIGDWKYIYQNKTINGGIYNQQSKQDGQWNELSKKFWDQSQVIYNGEYKNGKKVGRWVILYEGVEIGGGQYQEYQVNDNLNQHQIKQNILFGELDYYSICQNNSQDQLLPQSANIKADIQDHNLGITSTNKIGKWIELSDGFYKNSQVTYEGHYKNGKKIGRWDIWWKKDYDDKQKVKIGGGSYDEEFSVKIGNWIELSEEFWDNSQVTFKGEYKNGKKVDVWTIEAFGQQIGGGSYDKEGFNKIGIWVELCDGFFGAAQVIQKGEYLNGKKVGNWDICYQEQENQSFKSIGGGSYNKSDQVKIGNWVELSDGFWDRSQVTYKGEYKNGKKVGRWNSYLQKNYGDYQNVQIGGGTYNEQDSLKIGEWIDLSYQFIVFQQLVYKGEYRNGKKIGTWMEIEIRKNKRREFMNYDK